MTHRAAKIVDSCLATQNGGLDGTCGTTTAAANVICRADAGECDVEEVCDGVSNLCPTDTLEIAGTTCGDSSDTACTDPDTCDGMGSCLSNHAPSTVECRADAGDCDIAENCDGNGACPADAFEMAGTACGDASDTTCTDPDTCDSMGVCLGNHAPTTVECRADAGECDIADNCDGNGACSADMFEMAGTSCGDASDTTCTDPDSCDSMGVCQANHAASTVECRADAGDCDIAESCDGNGACPMDAFEMAGTGCGDASDTTCTDPDTCDGMGVCEDNHAPSTVECRADAGDCDIAENCDGNGACPTDLFETAGTMCGDSSDTTCTDPDSCDAMGACLPNHAPTSTVCRADAGECDVEETCDATGTCPLDGFEVAGSACGDPTDTACTDPDTCDAMGMCLSNHAPATASCRAVAGLCDVEDFCDGGGMCDPDGFVAGGTVCRGGSGDVCDPDEQCTGMAAACPPDLFENAMFVCNPGTGDVCDPAELCPGVAGGGCPMDIVSPNTTSCRIAADLCDAEELCSGVADDPCPPDDVHPTTVSCRSIMGACDVEDFCDGMNGACPADAVLPDGDSGSPMCMTYLCDGMSNDCPTTCVDDTDCVMGNWCDSGMCVPQGNPGDNCGGANECLSGFCANGVCCDTACDQICEDCTMARTGVADGTCAATTDMTDPDNDCTNGACNGNRMCALDDGQGCTMGGDCLSGNCADNVCCDMACNGLCEGCTALLTGGSNGQCLAIGAGNDPGMECMNGACDGQRMCVLSGGQPCMNDSECLSTMCRDGFCCGSDCNGLCEACDIGGAEGSCVPIPLNSDPDSECMNGACNGNFMCADDQGRVCVNDVDCLSGFCRDGFCCDGNCGANCESCDAADTGGVDGTCASVTALTDPDNDCPDGLCDGMGACLLDPGQSCLDSIECVSGFCVDGFCCASACDQTCESCGLSGSEGSCTFVPDQNDPDDECSGACNGMGQCTGEPGAPCIDQSECLTGFCADDVCCDSACDGDCESCDRAGSAGSCTLEAANTECRVSVGDCDAAEACDGMSGQCPADESEPDGSTCDDGDGVCVDGSCENVGTGGAGGESSTGGSSAFGGSTASGTPPPETSSGCGCEVVGGDDGTGDRYWLAVMALGLVAVRRRRRKRCSGVA